MQMLTFRTVYSHYPHVHAKFCHNLLNCCGVITNFQFPIWHSSEILNFGNMRILTFTQFIATICTLVQNVVAIFERLMSYMAAVHHPGFVAPHVILVVIITSQNLVQIGSVVLIISKFNNFCHLAGNCLFPTLL